MPPLCLGFQDQVVPTRRLLARPLTECRSMAQRMAAAIPGAEVIAAESVSGGGALPGIRLPSVVVRVAHDDVEGLAKRLRLGSPALVGRVHKGALLFDPRTVLGHQVDVLIEAVVRALGLPPVKVVR